jgi:AAA15 family ATPase/GTPase
MKIKSFTIKNYRSIKELKIDNLNPVNVFFGKNNVGKSNILRGLHLAFYCIKDDQLFLPDTTFFSRNIYRPIEVIVDLIIEDGFCDKERIINDIRKGIQDIRSTVSSKEEIFGTITGKVDQFVEASNSFQPVSKPRLRVSLAYSEETADVKISFEDTESDYRFDYEKYRILYRDLMENIKQKVRARVEKTFRSFLNLLRLPGIGAEDFRHLEYRIQEYRLDFPEIQDMLSRIERKISGIENVDQRHELLIAFERFKAEVFELKPDVIGEHFSNTFNKVKGLFDKISDNFILIPNKEYFTKAPFIQKGKGRIEIFGINKFLDRLLSLVISPNQKERKLIEKFYNTFNRSYSDLGRLETITKIRDEVFVIFGTGVTSLPVEDQGLGMQDLFVYLAHMILLDGAITAIEEPEGGLSTENQKLLHNVIEEVYLQSDKQIFISSHSEEFETPNSFIIEMDTNGTKQISRMSKEKEYEEKIETVLLKRKLTEEKTHLESLLREITERQMTLDVLNYISNLADEEKIDAQKIADKLGYKKERVQEILMKAAGKK